LLFRAFPTIPRVVGEKTTKAVHYLSSKRRVLWLPCILFFFVSAWIANFVYQRTPLVQDSASHLFQAKIFSQGRLYAPAPPISEFFSYEADELVLHEGRWFTIYLPGFALLLGLAMKIHAEWLLCPLLGAFSLAIWVDYARRWHSPQAALLVGLLGLCSPFLLVLSSTVMVHSPELFVASAVIYLSRKETGGTSFLRLCLLFLLMILAVLIRGFSLLPFLIAVIGYVSWKKLRNRIWGYSSAVVLGILCGCILLGLYQWKTTGHPLKLARGLEYPLKYGFGTNPTGRTHTPARGWEHLSNNVLGLNQWLSGGKVGSLFFIIAFLLLAPRLERWDGLLLISCGFLACFYCFYYFQDLVFGPRFWFVFAPFFLLLMARGILPGTTESTGTSGVVTSIFVITMFISVPTNLPGYVSRTNPSFFVNGYLKREIENLKGQKTILFLDQEVNQEPIGWNDPFLRDPVLICRDLREQNSRATAAFSDHQPVYFQLSYDFTNGKIAADYMLKEEPNLSPPGQVSLMRLAILLEAGKHYPDQDCFDLFYVRSIFNDSEVEQHWDYLEKKALEPGMGREYEKNFRLGLVHAGKVLLLPKVAFHRQGKNWKQDLDPAQFRNELQSAIRSFQLAGEVGKGIVAQMSKVQSRIDKDRNGNLSDKEVFRYISDKVDILIALGGVRSQ